MRQTWVGVGGTIEGIENREIIKGVVWTEVTYTNPIANGSSGSALLNCDGEIVAIVYGGGDTIAQHEKSKRKNFKNAVLWNSDDYKIVYEQKSRRC